MANGDITIPQVTANEQLAEWFGGGKAAAIEGGLVYPRSTIFGELMVEVLHGLRTPMAVKGGEAWCVTNTQGTAILDGNVSSFGATTPTLVLFNNNPAGGKSIYVERVKATVVAVGTTSSNLLSRWVVDTGNRFTSGGSPLTPTNPNLSILAPATGAVVNFGAITAPAANAARTIHIAQLRSVIPVAGDEYTFEFGSSAPRSVGMATDGTNQLSKMEMLPPVVLAPQQSLLWYQWGASQAAARSFDNINIEYRER